ncbi:MarR family winged helix-turn-helix transcriptional regulator [Lentzea sp.]|uniref:MarR family winged helix-turn-helix transcriptional regulator n=1 Tax=Lentzea sp. TaxID=56099 RepID=UPI002ED54CF1
MLPQRTDGDPRGAAGLSASLDWAFGTGRGAAGVDYGDKLFWLSVLIQRRYAQICAEYDLTSLQATLLCAIRDEPKRMTYLAAALGMTKNALSQLVDRTERRGLVTRAGSEQDRRVILLSVTPAGKVLAEAVFAETAKRLPDVAENLGADDQRAFERLATAIVDASGVPAS